MTEVAVLISRHSVSAKANSFFIIVVSSDHNFGGQTVSVAPPNCNHIVTTLEAKIKKMIVKTANQTWDGWTIYRT